MPRMEKHMLVTNVGSEKVDAVGLKLSGFS